MQKKPELVIIAGPNGCGKSTIAYAFSNTHNIAYLGADELAEELKKNGIKNYEIQAGKAFFKRLDEVLSANESVIIESTLSGLGLLAKIHSFKTRGFRVSVIFIFLDSANLCKKRIKIRVKKGGHNVPSQDVTRRYKRSLENFWNKYRFVADSWQLLYNGKDRPIEVAIDENDIFTVFDDAYFRKFIGKVE